ncbi:MAG: hypothetical protein HC917_17385 [Richelia sp. SM2_1_7]|nr:hypothetical protein [Richelia sp. SM2_1_7]
MKRKNLNIIIFSLIALLTAIAITTSNQSGLASQIQVSRNASKIPIELIKSNKVALIEEDQQKEEEWVVVTIVLLEVYH